MPNETRWSIDQPNSEITFKVGHLLIAHVSGAFKKYEANIYTKQKDFVTAEIDLCIDATSITTWDSRRDKHLKSVDFFDVENHRQITFISNTIGKTDKDGNHELWGELFIKGITKNIKLNVQFGGITNDPWGNEKAKFSVNGKINRSDWGLVLNASLESGGFILSDEITISCEVELINIGQKELAMELEIVNETIDKEAIR